MRCPEIISFHDGVIEWSAEQGVSVFVVKINGEVVTDDANDGFFRAFSCKIDTARDAEIQITAVGKSSATVGLSYSRKTKKLTLSPISEYKINGEILEWNGIGGVTEYRVYDIDFNAITVGCTHYDMSTRSLVRCVCPVPSAAFLCEASPANVKIGYLRGAGTQGSPYLIGTPFELRAVDYYETERAIDGGGKKHYRIERDIDFGVVDALDGDSNICALKKPFFGTLDGGGKRLSHMRVRYDNGYWALFDFIACGGCVRNVVFVDSDIYNGTRDELHPIDCVTAVVAYVNNGEISGVKLDGVRVTAAGGGACGIAVHNYGVVRECFVRGEFVQDVTSALGNASYEMAGVVLENRSSGVVCDNAVQTVTLRGTGDNIRAAAGVVSVNRAGGVVRNNSFVGVSVGGMSAGTECGGVVAYNSGTVERGAASLGVLVADGAYTDRDVGDGEVLRGKLVGKNDGEIF